MVRTCFTKHINIRLRPLNKVYKTNDDFLKVFERKIKIVLNPFWRLRYHTHDNPDGLMTCVVLISPENIEIHNRIQLLAYCNLTNICHKKVESISFKIFDFKPKKGVFLVEDRDTALQNAMTMIKTRNNIAKKLQKFK